MNDLENRVDKYASQIQANWQKMVSTILETATICGRADKRLSKREKQLLYEKLPFSRSVFSMLATVGKDSRLQEKGVVELLPPSYSSLYLLTEFSNDEIKDAINEGVLNKNAKRRELDTWFNGARGKKPRVYLPKEFYAGIRITGKRTTQLLTRIDELLAPLACEEGVGLVRHEGKVHPAWKRYERQIFAYVKKQMRLKVEEKWKREPLTKKAISEEMNVSLAFDFEALGKIAEFVEESEEGGAALMRELRAIAEKVIHEPDVQPISDPFAPEAETLAAEQIADLTASANSLKRSRRKKNLGVFDRAAFSVFEGGK